MFAISGKSLELRTSLFAADHSLGKLQVQAALLGRSIQLQQVQADLFGGHADGGGVIDFDNPGATPPTSTGSRSIQTGSSSFSPRLAVCEAWSTGTSWLNRRPDRARSAPPMSR